MKRQRRLSDVNPSNPFQSMNYQEVTRHSIQILRHQTSFRRLLTDTFRNKTKCVLKHSHPFRTQWDLFVLLLTLYNSFSIPFMVAFNPKTGATLLFWIDAAIDGVFLADIGINFRTTYIDMMTGEEVSNAWELAKRYMKSGRFFVDFISVLPFYGLGPLLSADSTTLELFSLLKMVRILRLSKILLYMRTRENVKLIFKFLQFLLFLLIYLHLIACCWHYLVLAAQQWSPPAYFDDDYFENDTSTLYAYAMYTSVEMLVGVEVMPRTTTEIAFAAAVNLAGALATAVLFGKIVVVLASLNRQSSNFNKIMDHIHLTMKSLKLPRKLQYEISDYLVSTQNTLAQQEEYKRFKNEVCPSYQAKVNQVLFNKLLVSTNIFSEFPRITSILISRTSNVFFNPEENIVKQHQASTAMYFLLIGELEVLVEGLDEVSHRCRYLESGDFFGEVGVLLDTVRTATVRVMKYATVAQIDKASFLEVMKLSPEMADGLKERANTEYRDPRIRAVDRLLRKVSYMRSLSDLEYTHLLFSLEPLSVPRGEAVLKIGEHARRLLLLIEGDVDLHFGVVCRDAHYKLRKGEYDRKVFARTLTNVYSEVPTYENTEAYFELYVCTFSATSILCTEQALVKAPVPIKLTATTPCKFLVLRTERIEQIAHLVSGTLRANIAIIRNKNCEINPKTDESIPTAPVIDGQQLFMTDYGRAIFQRRVRLKHAVLKVILANRMKQLTRNITFYSLVDRLIGLLKKERYSWGELKYKIDQGTLPEETLSLAQILQDNSYRTGVAKQMALVALEHQTFLSKVEDKLTNIQESVDDFPQETQRLQAQLQRFEELCSRLSSILSD